MPAASSEQLMTKHFKVSNRRSIEQYLWLLLDTIICDFITKHTLWRRVHTFRHFWQGFPPHPKMAKSLLIKK